MIYEIINPKFNRTILTYLRHVKVNKTGVTVIPDGEHVGKIRSCNYNIRNSSVDLDIYIEDEETLFLTSIDVADFVAEPLLNLTYVMEENGEIIWNNLEGYDIRFVTKASITPDCKTYCYIDDLELILE